MNFFGKLNQRLGAIAQGAIGGLPPKISRLDEWYPDSPPARTDYEALWLETVSPVHPLVDAQIRLRVEERNAENPRACMEPAFTGALDALDATVKATIAVEALKRYVFLNYCLYASANGSRPPVALEGFGATREALGALYCDFDCLTKYLFGRVRPKLDAEQTASLAWVVGFVAGDACSMTVRTLLYTLQPAICDVTTSADERKKPALQRLYVRLGESPLLAAGRDPMIVALVENLAKLIGASADQHPVLQAKRREEGLREEWKQAVTALGGPHLRAFFEAAFRDNAFGQYFRNYVKDTADMSGPDALSPRERAEALFGCLRVLNFTSQCGKHPARTAWPECKLTSVSPADHPNIKDYPDSGYALYMLEGLFQHLAKRKLDLDEDMQWELLRIFRSEAASRLVQSLQVVKIVEGFAKGNTSVRVREELEATIAWLKKTDDHYTKKLAAGALHRLEKAHASMAGRLPASGAAEARVDAAPTPVSTASGEFGKRVASPAEGPVAAAWPDLVRPPEEARLDPPRGTGRLDRTMPLVSEFYGDLGDLRKCSAEHIAFLDELIEIDANPEADLRRAVEVQVAEMRAAGIPEAQARQGAALFGLRGPLPRGQYREAIERTKARVAMVAGLTEPARSVWSAFYDHARMLYGKSKPAAAWLKAAYEILDRIAPEEQIALTKAVLCSYPCSRAPYPIDDAVRGIIYSAVRLPAEEVGTAIADFARKECFQTVPGAGIRDQRMGNACLWTLINMPGGKGVPYLARLLNRIKYPSVKKTINAALDEAAAKAGMSRGMLDELSVPTHELEDGQLEIAVGAEGGAAILTIVGTADVEIAFRRPDGKESASVPTALKEHKRDIAQARAAAKEIEADLTTQIARLQQLWLAKRDWSFADWDARYARHPLLAHLTAKLIWTVSDGQNQTPAIPVGGALHDVDGKPVDAVEARISLWHPIGRPVPEVLAWRKRLAALDIVQPFKQAHREVYYVTDAERATAVYSNRFAGHILRQHQMMTLARLNNWNVTHRIWADVRNDEPTNRVIPAWNIVAEIWTRGAGGDNPEVSDSAAYLFVSTDQVRFYAIAEGAGPASTARGPERGEAIRMEAVPEIVFSEVMRHCDLFTSVASVANDPDWIDSGADAEHPDQWRRTVAEGYWRDTAFGDLTQTAQSRKEALKEILPALKIADRCSFDGNYLRVRGNVRDYKIHLGSGNILMEPDNRYLCIVRASASGDRVRLPFEGDNQSNALQ